MPRGGPRNRGGRPPDPGSLRSARRAETDPDFLGRPLPREGHKGRPPKFPLPGSSPREVVLWRELWRTPQAAAWAGEPWRWRAVALYVRWTVRMEEPGAAAALAGVVIRLGDQIGLTPAGLRENGWAVARDVPLASPRRPSSGPDYRARFTASARDRLTVVETSSPEETQEPEEEDHG